MDWVLKSSAVSRRSFRLSSQLIAWLHLSSILLGCRRGLAAEKVVCEGRKLSSQDDISAREEPEAKEEHEFGCVRLVELELVSVVLVVVAALALKLNWWPH